MSVPVERDMSAKDSSDSPRRGPGGYLIRLVVALVITLWVFAPLSQWVADWRMLAYNIPYLLAPRTGFLSLVLALFLLLAVPGLLSRWGAPRRRGSAQTDMPGAAHTGFLDRPIVDEDMVRVPTATFRDLGAEHRWQMAQALDIPWTDELIHDDRAWATACLESADRVACRLRG